MGLKIPVVRDEKHLAYIRSLRCLVCRISPCDAAHIRTAANSGVGTKPGDDATLCLCRAHHGQQHNVGQKRFYADLGRTVPEALELAAQLYQMTGDKDRGYWACLGWART